jgi:hypothetical protein
MNPNHLNRIGAKRSHEFRNAGVVMKLVSTRRELLRAVLAGSAGSLLSARWNSAAAAATNIVASSFPGVWQDGLKAGVIPCYTAKNGGDVALVFGTPSDRTEDHGHALPPRDRCRHRNRRGRIPERATRNHR